MIDKDLRPGDRVQFDIEGKKEDGPHGYGRISRITKGAVIVAPEKPLPGNARMINICKAEAVKK